MQATATATDPFGLTDSDTVTINTGGATGIRTVRTSMFANRINWGNSVDETTQGPDLNASDFVQAPAGPVTLGHTVTAIANCRSVGVRIYKHPLAAGTIPVALWDAAGTVLASKTVTWSADGGGWVTVTWNAPVNLTADADYNVGYLYPGADSHYAVSIYVLNGGIDIAVYPLLMKSYSSTGAGVKSGGSWLKTGGALTFSNAAADRSAANYYIDPIVEWDIDTPGYSSGESYFGQFVNGGSRFAFPIAVYWADPPYLAAYKALGINTMFAGSVTDDYAAVFKAADMDWYPTLHDGDMSAPIAVQEDPELAELIRGYMLTDEPEFNFSPFNPPSTVRAWRDACRRIDSTRPIFLNLSRLVLENQGFVWHPVGINARDVNLQWREYLSLADMGSLDCYGIANTFPYTYSTNDSHRYGIWIYPLTITRLRAEVVDERMPIWGIVETTSSYPNAPTPTQVKRAVWSMLIAGARGIEYFDHRFSSPAVSQDFAAMLSDPAMSSAVSALNTQMQSLAAALWAPDAGLIESYTSTGTLAHAQGGYAAGAKIPVHYTSRLADGTTFLFVQAIRDGSTTATLHAPSLAGATLTVIGESRTVSIDGSGFFTDAFSSGDYTYHLYSTATAPTFTAPANTVAPSIITDGTPQTGETVSASTGTWSGVPTPVAFVYQWQRSGDAGATWSDIAGAAIATYTLVFSDQGDQVRCEVTATNAAGSATAATASITPAAASSATAHGDAVLALNPVAYWRLTDLTDASGNGRTLTSSGGVSDATGLIGDSGEGAKHFTTESQSLSVTDAAALRLTTAFSAQVWISPDSAPAAFWALQKHLHYRIGTGVDGKVHAIVFTGGSDFWEMVGTTTVTAHATHHVVVTFDGATARLYVDGAQESTIAVSTAPNSATTHVCIGKDLDSTNTGWFGIADEVALFDTVLDAGDVLTLYETGTA